MKKDNPLYEVKGETLVICLPEELDHHTAGKIRENTDELFLGRKIRNVIFDYTNTVFMDSSGIGLVMGRYREVRYLNGNVYIVGVHTKIARILEISGLYRVAVQTQNVADALKDIQSRQEKYEKK
ncbi:MAG: anti-sigma factor antagonist [Lachnospiraceae bacterium]|nr:anti-sigma factor antagonist [Lachnospiraceae bacterium]